MDNASDPDRDSPTTPDTHGNVPELDRSNDLPTHLMTVEEHAAYYRLMAIDPDSEEAHDLVRNNLALRRYQLIKKYEGKTQTGNVRTGNENDMDLTLEGKTRSVTNPNPPTENMDTDTQKIARKMDRNEDNPPTKRKFTKKNSVKMPLSDFHLPSKKHTAKMTVPKPIPSTSQSNRFEILEDESPTENLTIKENLNIENANKNTNRVKPIFIRKFEDYRKTLLIIAQNVSSKFLAKPAKEFVKINPETLEAHNAIVKFIIENKIQNYIIPSNLSKPFKAVIRGLETDFPIEDIHQNITAHGIEVIKLTQMISRREGKFPLPLFQIHIPDIDDQIIKLFAIKHINFIGVKFEKYRNPPFTLQCFKCQYFHHKMENCNINPRCVKCGEEHQAKDCKIQNTLNRNELTCCNCGQKGHPASYRGCVKFPKNRIQRNFVKKNVSFAAMAARNTVHENPPPNSPPKQIAIAEVGEANCLETNKSGNILSQIARATKKIEEHLKINSLADILAKLNNFLDELENCNSHEDKVYALLSNAPKLFPQLKK